MRGNIESLPKWAQAEISRLQHDLKWLEAKLSAGPEDSRTFADPYSDAPRPLGLDPTIEFRLGEGEARGKRIRVKISEDGEVLEISGDDSIHIQPRSSNSIQIKSGRYF